MAELRAEIQEKKRAIASLTRKRKVAERSRACGSDKAWPCVVRGALVVWAMRSDADLAEAFLEEWPQNRHEVAPWSQEQLRQKMNTLTETEKEQLLRPTTRRGKKAGAAATKFLTERSLLAWVQKQNSDKGLAPSYAALWRQFEKEVDKERISLQEEPDALPASDKHKRQRMRRWSRRWNVVQGRYKAGLRLPLETLRQKAGDSDLKLKKVQPQRKFGAEKCEFGDPSLVPRIRSPFLGPRIMRTIKGEAGIRAPNRRRFSAPKTIFGHKFDGQRRKKIGPSYTGFVGPTYIGFLRMVRLSRPPEETQSDDFGGRGFG